MRRSLHHHAQALGVAVVATVTTLAGCFTDASLDREAAQLPVGPATSDTADAVGEADTGDTDSGATADPVIGSASWTASSPLDDTYFGWPVASAGDVNGDGFDDVVVGARRYDGGIEVEGQASLYLGSASGLTTDARWTAESEQYGGGMGSAVAAAGDVDGDGFGDVVVGAYGYDNGDDNGGRAYLYMGSPQGLAGDAAWTAMSDEENGYFGVSAGSAGDVNADGYDDVVVGAYGIENEGTGEGRAYVFLGSPSGLAATAAWTAWIAESESSRASFGYSASSAGDVNGDGFADVVVGAKDYENGEYGEGKAEVYSGSSSGLETSPAWSAELDEQSAAFGRSVAPAGDVNGDGYDDVVVGAPGSGSSSFSLGRAYVYLGSQEGLATSAAWIAESSQEEDYFGASVASAGDVDGDGFADVVVGAFYYETGGYQAGGAFAYLGSAAGLATDPAWTAAPAQSGQEGASFGASVASAGDVNGDGYADVVVGAPAFASGTSDGGQAFGYLGLGGGGP